MNHSEEIESAYERRVNLIIKISTAFVSVFIAAPLSVYSVLTSRDEQLQEQRLALESEKNKQSLMLENEKNNYALLSLYLSLGETAAEKRKAFLDYISFTTQNDGMKKWSRKQLTLLDIKIAQLQEKDQSLRKELEAAKKTLQETEAKYSEITEGKRAMSKVDVSRIKAEIRRSSREILETQNKRSDINLKLRGRVLGCGSSQGTAQKYTPGVTPDIAAAACIRSEFEESRIYREQWKTPVGNGETVTCVCK